MRDMQAELRIGAGLEAELLAKSLEPEIEHEVSRTRVEILPEGDELVIKIEAEDLVALRAAINSYLRWTKLAIDTQNVIGAR